MLRIQPNNRDASNLTNRINNLLVCRFCQTAFPNGHLQCSYRRCPYILYSALPVCKGQYRGFTDGALSISKAFTSSSVIPSKVCRRLSRSYLLNCAETCARIGSKRQKTLHRAKLDLSSSLYLDMGIHLLSRLFLLTFRGAQGK